MPNLYKTDSYKWESIVGTYECYKTSLKLKVIFPKSKNKIHSTIKVQKLDKIFESK